MLEPMKFQVPDKETEFNIPNEWWFFSEMNNFSSDDGGYYPYSDTKDINVVNLSEIEPPKRNPNVPQFKKNKMVPILLSFTSPECALPPVEVKKAQSENSYKYEVTNGYHRYYASVAVGYNKLPVVIRKPCEF